MYFNWVQLQKAADAAALAGAGWLVPSGNTPGPVAAACASWRDVPSQQACTYAFNNGMTIDANNLKISNPGLAAPAPTPNIQVWVNRSNLPYIFGKVIGLNTYNVSAKATATNEPGGNCSSCNLFPILYECKKDLNGKCLPCNALTGACPGMSDQYGAHLTFGWKFSSVNGTGSNGNWSWLDVGQGRGGSQLQTAVSGGYLASNLSVGSPITTDPGVDTGNVNAGWNARMAAHNSMPGAVSPDTMCTPGNPSPKIPTGDPLLVTIPVADLSGSGCSGRCTIPIMGFAEIYLTGLTKSVPGPNWQLTGCVVNEPTPKLGGDPNAPSLGTNAIALIQ
jgi:hypothetical protein